MCREYARNGQTNRPRRQEVEQLSGRCNCEIPTGLFHRPWWQNATRRLFATSYMCAFIFRITFRCNLRNSKCEKRECMGIEPTESFVQTPHWF
jgi:hypothetical protein